MAGMAVNGQCRSFNGDGRLDILARKDSTGELFVFPHSGRFDGASTFGPPQKIADGFGWDRYVLVRAVDFHGTGHADVLAVSESEVNPGHPHGHFLHPNVAGLDGMSTLAEPIRVSGKRDDGRLWETVGHADITGSGRDDSFGREKDSGNVHWFRHRGEVVENETYDKTPIWLTTVEPEDFPFAMADVTGNGRLDLLVRRANGDLDVLEFPEGWPEDDTGGRSGTWHTVGKGFDNPLEVLLLTDIDLDGRPDLLVRRLDGTLDALVHNGKFDPTEPLGTFSEPVRVAVGFDDFFTIS